jgi:hypothetical protein
MLETTRESDLCCRIGRADLVNALLAVWRGYTSSIIGVPLSGERASVCRQFIGN